MRAWRLGIVFLIVLGLASLVHAEPPRVVPRAYEPGVTVSLTLPDRPGALRRVTVDLVAVEQGGLVVLEGGQRTTFVWAEVSPGSTFQALLRAERPKTGQAWLELAELARAFGAEKQSDEALRRAVAADASLKAQAEAIEAMELGGLRVDPAEPEAEPATDADPASDLPEVVGIDGRRLPPKFVTVTPTEAARGDEIARWEAQQAQEKLGVRLRVIQTEHFLIFTNWDRVDDPWLEQQLESAYQFLSREFHVGPEQTVFVGRLPVYMFDTQEQMLIYAREFDRFDASDMVAGYHATRGGGFNKLVMSKPRATAQMGLPVARQRWARTLVHEFVHAFLARYRGEKHLPRWLDEGLAEMLAETIYPRPHAEETARTIARSGRSVAEIFDDRNMPGGHLYPVMMSMTNGLYRQDPPRFVAMVDRIKAGEDAETMLMEHFGVDYARLEQLWRESMR
ncbi:MAG: hypothetical protein AAGI46_09645 [Planctomycetota bacterium]